MSENGKRRMKLDRINIDPEKVGHRDATIVVTPAISRRPEMDALLGDMAFVAKAALQEMRTAVIAHRCEHCGRGATNAQELRKNKWIFETVLKQARVEMDLEKHVEAQTAGMDEEDLATDIENAIYNAWRPNITKEEVVELMLSVADLPPRTPASRSLPSASAQATKTTSPSSFDAS